MSPIWNLLICKEVNNAYGMVMFNMQLYNKTVVCVMVTNRRTVRQHNYSYHHRNIKPFQSGWTQKTDSHIREYKQKGYKSKMTFRVTCGGEQAS
jgi:hypothetical protein